ncbi:hypothetical protein TNCT_50391 [Trichonephila clavata]|uniref:Uncharacterized protein n=1 Tax=Trichonephila clavata TaxID=2740835 RepID=A0A8X6KEY3_TRICU|nr:hypothetical protein TNCT_50391 [Trichonephila clavata]
MNEIKEGKESEESSRALLRYFDMTRFVLLKSLSICSISPKFNFLLDEVPRHELSDVADVVQKLLLIFRADFDKILESGDDVSRDPEIKRAEFLLSRCKLLCLEPTYSSFLLVSAFLNNLILSDGENIECFQILYITEFCLLVLYRRLFWKIFNSKDSYVNLQKFCEQFQKSFTLDSTLSDLGKTTVGENWINSVQRSVDTTDNLNFSLEDFEVNSFEDDYSATNHMECVMEYSREIESILFPCKSEIETFCETCKSKCHNYLSYGSQFYNS